MNDNADMGKFRLGDTCRYRPNDPLRTPKIVEYLATVISSAQATGKGVKYRIEYKRDDGKTVCSWVFARKLR